MRDSRRSIRVPRPGRAPKERRRLDRILGRSLFLVLSSFLFAFSAFAQDVGSKEKEFFGNGSVIAVAVHDSAGGNLSSLAVVKLLIGITPCGQRETTSGTAEFVVTRFGEYSVVVSAAGYAESRKDITVDAAGRSQVDVYLRGTLSVGGAAGVPGRPLLAPKAREALDKGLRALGENKLKDADKYLSEAIRLAPRNPDVLYVQGVLNLKQENWKQAQAVLEEAAQFDPNSSRTFAALGMALCNQGNYEAAITPLTKSLQLDPAGTWETQWAVAKSLYHLQRYEEAVTFSQKSLQRSHGNAPEIALLVAQSLTAVGRYEDAAQVLRQFLAEYGNRPEAVTARRWLDRLTASGNIRSN